MFVAQINSTGNFLKLSWIVDLLVSAMITFSYTLKESQKVYSLKIADNILLLNFST